MSLTLNVDPVNKFVFSRLPIGIEVTSDNVIDTVGVKYTRTVTFINYPTTDGVLFQLVWPNGDVSMTSMATPITEDGAHYRKRAGAETLATWIAHFAADIATNFYISRDFDITYTTTTLTFTAKYAGIGYIPTTIDMPGTLTTDYTLGAATAGVDEVLNENFHVFLDVYFASDDYVRIEMFRTDAEATGYFEAQIQKVLHSRIKSPFPESGGATAIKVLEPGDIMIKYWFAYFEFFGATPVASHYYINNNSAAYWYAVMGGHYLEKTHAFLLNYASSFKYLTWQKRIKYVTKDQPEWLYWLVANTDSLFGKLVLVIHYTDASTTTVNYDWEVTQLIAMYKAVGYYQIVEPNIASGKTVEYWTVKITPTDEVEPLTGGETFTYYPVTDGTPWYKHFVFRNSFGGYDTYRNRGQVSTGLDITGSILSKWLNADFEYSDGEFENGEFKNMISHTCSIGFEDEEQMIDYLREIFVNPKAAIATQIGTGTTTKFIPIVIEPKSIRVKMDGEFLYSFEFNYKEAYNDGGVYEIME